MRGVPTYRQLLYLLLVLAVIAITGGTLLERSELMLALAGAFSLGVLGLRELVVDILTADTGDTQ